MSCQFLFYSHGWKVYGSLINETYWLKENRTSQKKNCVALESKCCSKLNLKLVWNHLESEVTQSCLTLHDPMDCSLPGSSIHGIFHAKVLEWVAIAFSSAWNWKVKSLSFVRLCTMPETAAHQAPPSLGFSRQEHWSKLPFPSPMHESEKWKWSCSVMSTFSDSMDCSLPGSSIHEIFQARVLECGAIGFSIGIILRLIKMKHNKGLLWLMEGDPHGSSARGSPGEMRGDME